jgi:ribose transport system ATP-binding protein
MSLDESTMAGSSNPPAAGPDPAAGNGLRAISVVGARKYFGVTRALDGCSFSARLGEIHAIVGGNGCGKSTLAKVISGVLPLDDGQVEVLGRIATTPPEARDIGIATVFQEVLVADQCTIVDNIFMGADPLFSKVLSSEDKTRAAAAMMRDLTGERIDVHDLVGTLPLGTKQWITIARALMTNPKVLILDESSAALDFDSTERLFAKMRQLRDQGAAVIIVSHRIAELIRVSDRATVMRDGRDVGVLEKQDITERNILALMTGQAEGKSEAYDVDEAVLEAPVVLKTEGLRIWEGAEAIDLKLHRGEILGVAGLDGQGQSEFVKILAGIRPAHKGAPFAVGEGGEAVAIATLDEAVAKGIVYVSGDRKREGTFANLSIFENMLMPIYGSRAHGRTAGLIDWKSLEGVFAWEVDRLAIKMGDRGDKITSLSGGNQQKVLIARGFAMKPNTIVLNDPARGVDAGAKTELYRHLRDFAASGKSVVYMSSELEEFIDFATRVIVFRHGSVFDEFIGASIDPARILEAMFGQTAGMSRREARRNGGRGSGRVRIEAMAPPGPVANPLTETPLPQANESPVRSGGAKRSVSIAKPPTPHVPYIKIVDFDAETGARRDTDGSHLVSPRKRSLS